MQALQAPNVPANRATQTIKTKKKRLSSELEIQQLIFYYLVISA